MFDVFEVVLAMLMNIAFPAWVVRWDERRLPALALSRAWNPASFWIAVVAFGPLCLPVHFVRTRRSIWGFLLGIFAFATVILCQVAVSAVIGTLRPE
jgi:hypothetical protein